MAVWILISSSTKANLFSTDSREGDWSLVEEFDHPEGREMSRDIRPSSPPGRMQQSKGPGGRRTALEPHTSVKEAEAERFAKTLAVFLDEATAKHGFDDLVLVAPPHFMGLLHGALGRQTAKHLRATVEKDYVALDVAEMRARLIDSVFPPKPATPE
jgi:protein required for attachment to host cells